MYAISRYDNLNLGNALGEKDEENRFSNDLFTVLSTEFRLCQT